MLSDGDKDGLSKHWLSFYSVWFSFLFFFSPLLQMWVGLQRKGWECCLSSQHENKGRERVSTKRKEAQTKLGAVFHAGFNLPQKHVLVFNS